MNFMWSFNSSGCHCCVGKQALILALALISFSLSIERIKSIMLILYLLLACPQSFVISLLLLIWCNVMKCLEAALGACLAGATGVGATSRSPLKHIRLSRQAGRWGLGDLGDSREQPQTERQGDRCLRGGRDHPLRRQHPPTLITLRGLSFTCMCNYTPPCPTPLPRNLSQHLIPTGRAPQGGLCSDRPPRPEGLLRVTTIQVWPPTSIKDP